MGALAVCPAWRARGVRQTSVSTVARWVCWFPCLGLDGGAWQVLVGVYGLLALGLMCAFLSLLGFHAFLMYRGMGTYDWLIRGFQASATPSENQESQTL